jgi:hypothetical protein
MSVLFRAVRPSPTRWLLGLAFVFSSSGCGSDASHDNAAAGGSSGGSPAGGGPTTAGAGGTSGGAAPDAGGAAGSFAGGAAGSAGSGGAGEPSASFFVAPTGNDDGPGTLEEPFATLSRARDAVREINTDMREDIVVYLRGGRYEMASTTEFAAEDSGTNGFRVRYQAYAAEVPVLSGANLVTGWTQHDGEIYKAPLARSTKLRNLYVNDVRALMSSKTVTAQGGEGTYSVSAGEESWAWASGSKSDGVKYSLTDVPDITTNADDLEIVNGTTWNENIVCVRDVVTTGDDRRALLLQQPYGAIAQLPGWNAGFSTTGTHTIYNAMEFLTAPGRFYFDKASQTLYYYRRPGEDMSSAEVEAPRVETLVSIAGESNDRRVHDITFEGITFQSTDYMLRRVGDSCGKATVQGATTFVAFGNGDWHASKYEIIDTLPAMIEVQNADSIAFVRNVIKHSGSEGISMTNDVVESSIVGNYIHDIAGSGVTVGHPQHVYLGDGGDHAAYAPGVEGICTNDRIENNFFHDVSSVHGFGGHAGVTAFFVEGLIVEHNTVQTTAYNGINLGWGWRNFKDSTTCKDNSISNNRLIDTLHRLHDSGAIYTIGQMPGTTIDENYVKGIPAASSGPTYGLHNDEGSAYITENDNVLDISPGVTYTINCEDFGEKHDLTILRTYATVNKMGAPPPNSTIDPPVAIADNVWPLAQYETCVTSGLEDEYRDILPEGVIAPADYVFPASVAVSPGESIVIRSSGDGSSQVWVAPAGTTEFVAGADMTVAAGDSASIAAPQNPGNYRVHVVAGAGGPSSESASQVRVE